MSVAAVDGQRRRFLESFGGRDRVRTCDPLLAKQVLSQLSYTPTVGTTTDFRAFSIVRKLRNPGPCFLKGDPFVEHFDRARRS